MSSKACKRGEIWLVDFNPARGSEQKGTRPALVLQNDLGNRFASTTIIAAVTTTLKAYPVTVILSKGEGGLQEPSMVNLAQILTIDKDRLIKKIGSIPSHKISKIDDAVKVSLGIA